MLLFYSQPMSVFIIDCPSFCAIPLAKPSLGGNSQVGKRSEEISKRYFSKQRFALFCERTSKINCSFRLIFLR